MFSTMYKIENAYQDFCGREIKPRYKWVPRGRNVAIPGHGLVKVPTQTGAHDAR